MKFLKLASLFLTVAAITVGIMQLTNMQQSQQSIDINLSQPGPAPPPQYQYLQVSPGSPFYFTLPSGWPGDYYTCPQFYFYFEPGVQFYRPGVSVFLGHGWWHTPGCGL